MKHISPRKQRDGVAIRCFWVMLLGLAAVSETSAQAPDCETCHNIVSPPHAMVNNIACHDCHALRDFDEKLRGGELATMCKSCHNPLGSAAEMSDVSNHVVNDGTTVIDCTQCHFPHRPSQSTDPHAGGTTADNLNLIREDFSVYLPEALPVTVFHEKPAHYAFEESSPPYNGVCQSCHTQTEHHTNDESGDHEHYPGSSCVSCHTHSNGFLPSGADSECVGCDSQLQGSGRQIVESEGGFAKAYEHVDGSVQGSDCIACKDIGEHQLGTVRLNDPNQGSSPISSHDPNDPAK